MTVIRDLTDKEFTEALRLCAFLRRFNHINPFADSCFMLAKNRYLTRGQFNKIKEIAKRIPTPEQNKHQNHFGPRRSKRPVTLVKI